MKHLVYCPQLNATTGSVTSTLLLLQLEHWFGLTKGTPFYKFLEACEHPSYRTGDSWTEELGFGKTEFRTAFGRIGKVYKSKRAYLESKDKFEGKYYLSYYDRMRKLTFYVRNDHALASLLRNAHLSLGYSKDKHSHKTSNQSNQTMPAPKHLQTSIDPMQVIKLFDAHCPSLAGTTTWTATLTKRLKELLKQLEAQGLDVLTQLQEAFRQVEHSDYLCGRLPHRPWRAFLSWILRPDKFFAILKGAYAPFATPPAPASPCPPPIATPAHTRPAPFSKFRSTFHLVESHNFDMSKLEAQERAFQLACYEARILPSP